VIKHADRLRCERRSPQELEFLAVGVFSRERRAIAIAR
jgi:hypothetical protein